jgi:hypothetical protein
MIDGLCGSPSGCGVFTVHVSLCDSGIQAYKLFRIFVSLNDKHSSYWGNGADNLTAFTAFVLGREAFPAWRDRGWFDGMTEGMPDLFTQAAAQWFWAKNNWDITTGKIGNIKTGTDLRNAVMNWLGGGMESLRDLFGLDRGGLDKVLDKESFKWDSGMLGVAKGVLDPNTAHGNVAWYWGNASLPKWEAAQSLLVDATIGSNKDQIRYRFGRSNPKTAWYIMDKWQNEYWKNIP